ncbi:MAG: hypothetical protein HYY03_05790 [Chloroflexi bacterium]|nr:hypothetical protein [Chloroflexota bacterium]
MSDRLQKEIEELLSRLDTFPPRRSVVARARDAMARPFSAAGRWARGLRLPHVSAGHILLLAIAIMVVGYLAQPGGDAVTRYDIASGIVLFIAAFVLSLRRQSRAPEKRWRERPLDLSGPAASGRPRPWWGRWRGRH